VFGGVGVGLVVVDGRSFFRLPKIVTTLIAKVILRCILRLAIRAYARKLRPALTAKLCLFSIIKLTFWALHF